MGSVSLRATMIMISAMEAVVTEKIAGYWKEEKSVDCEVATEEKYAPRVGPNMNPNEKATPINACTTDKEKLLQH